MPTTNYTQAIYYVGNTDKKQGIIHVFYAFPYKYSTWLTLKLPTIPKPLNIHELSRTRYFDLKSKIDLVLSTSGTVFKEVTICVFGVLWVFSSRASFLVIWRTPCYFRSKDIFVRENRRTCLVLENDSILKNIRVCLIQSSKSRCIRISSLLE